MILVSNNRESTKLLEAFPLNLRRNKDVSEYKCTGKDNSLEGKKKKKVVLIHQGQGHVPCQQAQLSCTEAILLHLLEHIGLHNSVLNTERKSSMV